MTRVLLALVLCAPVLALAQEAAPASSGKDALVQGDATAGATKAAACFACHGPGGNGAINPQWPKLAGQHSAYILEQLGEFTCTTDKCVARKNPVMFAQAMGLPNHEQDMRDLAAFFASQKPVPGVASPDSVAVAQSIYRAGDSARGLPACAGCHGPTGAGNGAAQFPRIGGQNSGYSANQLHAYASCAASELKNCDRGGAGKGLMMSAIAAKLKENEIQALASYVSGLQ
ncbi:MAG: cytochrome c4 [Nevskia sp.]|nr:cytochrome c4 [Nevskia sp.]